MDRSQYDDVDADVGTTNDAVLVCATDRQLRTRVADLLREEYPVRTADSERDAVASIDETVTVLVVDASDHEFSLDRIDAEREGGDCRFQVAALVEETATAWLRRRCDGFVRKPFDDAEVRSTVRWLYRRGRYDRTLGAYYALSEKYARLSSDPDAGRAELRPLEEQLTQLRDELDALGDRIDEADALDVALGDVDDPA